MYLTAEIESLCACEAKWVLKKKKKKNIKDKPEM
jgi:hypothetical protein